MGHHSVKINRSSGSSSLLPAVRGNKTERFGMKKAKTVEKDLKNIASKFGLSTKEISKMIDGGDVDRAVGFFQKKMLSAVVNLIPIAEKKYKKYGTQGHAYALNAMISGARELASDLQATADRQKLALTIVQEILMPAFRAIVQSIVDEHYTLKRDLEDYSKTKYTMKMKERIDQSGQVIAKHARAVYENTSGRINDMLVR